MVTDDDMHDLAAPDARLAFQRAQVAQYWQRCYESRADCKLSLSRSLSASNTHISDEDDDEEDDEEEDDDDVVDIDIDDDEPEDAEYEYRYVHYRRRASQRVVSGLPLLCGNCGVSFFSLQSVDDEEDCYCSGECKWSVIMYREMDRRMCALRASRARSNGGGAATREDARRAQATCRQYDDGIPCH